MTKLNFTLTLDDACNLTATEITGYYDVSSNPFGFLPEANSDALTYGIYKLSYGYFLNVLLYNKFNVTPIIANSAEGFYKVPNSISSTYANNFTPTVYSLTSDGTYTFKRFFIISDTFYNANVSLFSGHDVYYTDGTTIFNVLSGIATPITVTAFINATLSNASIVELDNIFISTCKLNACYYKLMSVILDAKLENCPGAAYEKLVEQKDLIFMTLECIKYLKEDNALTQIEKLIEAVQNCCSVCSAKLSIPAGTTVSRGGCGCA